MKRTTRIRRDRRTPIDLETPKRRPADGLTRSRIFPGLALDLPAILRGDMDRVDAALRAELAGPEHAGFRDRLAAAAAGR